MVSRKGFLLGFTSDPDRIRIQSPDQWIRIPADLITPPPPNQPKQNEEIACLMRLSFARFTKEYIAFFHQFISPTVHFLHFCHRKPWSTSGSRFNKAWIRIRIQRIWIRIKALHKRIHHPYLTYKVGILCNFSPKTTV